MSRTPLRVSLVAILFFTTLNADAPARAQSAAAKTQVEPRASVEGDAGKAEELCSRGEELSKSGDTRGALEALGESSKLYTRIYTDERAPAPGTFTSFRSSMAARLRRAPECVELYTRLGGGASDFERAQLAAFRAHALGLIESDPTRAVFFGQETDTRADITYRPPPAFPRSERSTTAAHGTVRLRVVLDASGVVRDVFALSGMPGGFMDLSIEAAKSMRFKPALKDGSPASQFATVEYNYNKF